MVFEKVFIVSNWRDLFQGCLELVGRVCCDLRERGGCGFSFAIVEVQNGQSVRQVFVFLRGHFSICGCRSVMVSLGIHGNRHKTHESQ